MTKKKLLLENRIFNTCPPIVHLHGFSASERSGNFKKAYDGFNPLWDVILQAWEDLQLPAKKSSGPSGRLTILTCNSRPEPGYLEKSLETLGLDYEVLGKGVKEWKNILKVKLYYEALCRIETPYTAGLDSFDCLMLRNPESGIDELKKRKCRMLFNASMEFYPNCGKSAGGTPFLTEDWKAFQEKHAHGPWHYLNAGVWIGETAFCRRFFQECLSRKITDLVARGQLPAGSKNSWQNIEEGEQVLIHWVFRDLYPDVQLDDECRFAQTTGFVPLQGFLRIKPLSMKARILILQKHLRRILYTLVSKTRPVRSFLGFRKSTLLRLFKSPNS